MIAKIPSKVSRIMAKSNLRICSFKTRKARTTTTMGAKFVTIEIMVAGMNFVTEYLMRLVVTPVKVLKARPPDFLHSI